MKSPKMPTPQKAEMPTAPKVNASGLLNYQNERRREKGVFSTLMGSNSPTSDRLRSYLNGASTVYGINNPSSRTHSGIKMSE